MHDAIRKNPNVRVLESLDWLTAFQTARKEGVDRARDRVEDGIVVAHWVLSAKRFALKRWARDCQVPPVPGNDSYFPRSTRNAQRSTFNAQAP